MTDFNRDSGRERNTRRSDSRVPPHNLNAEESLLGALLLSREVVDQISELHVLVEHFYKPSHQHIYAAIRGLVFGGQPVDAVTVADELRRNGLLDEIGGPQTLLELQNATPAISNASRYAKIVQDTALLRKLIGVASDIAEIAYLEPDDVTKALDEAETKVFEIAEDRITDTTRSLSDLLPLAMDKLQETFERGDIITGTATGFHDLDEILSGLQPSTLNIIGARPAMGKTSLGLGIAAYVAQTARRPVLIFSLEMGHTELTQRILSSEAEVDSQKLRTGRLVEADWTKIGKAINRLDVPLYLDDNPQGDGDGDPRQGPPHEGPPGWLGADRHRLPAADERWQHGREPSTRSQRDQSRPQDPGPRAGGADHRPQPAQPKPRNPRRQAPDAVRPT